MNKELQKDIHKYYAISGLSQRVVTPILVVFFLAHELSKTEIGSLLALGTLIGLVLEVPSGAFADRIGHARAITLAFFLKSISMLFYIFGNSFSMFFLATAIYWAGRALWSGTNSAFLFEKLDAAGSKEEYEHVSGIATFLTRSVNAVFLVCVPFLYAYHEDLAFLFSGTLFLLAALLASTISSPVARVRVAEKEGFSGLIGCVGRSLSFIKNNKRYVHIALFFAFWRGIHGAIDEFRQLLYQSVGITTELFGFLYGIDKMIFGLGAYCSGRIRRFKDRKGFLNFFGASTVLSLLGPWIISSPISVIFFPIRNLFEGIGLPLFESQLHHEIPSEDRATLISIVSVAKSIVTAAFTFALGVVFDLVSVSEGFLIMGSATAIIFLILHVMRKRTSVPAMV